MATRHIRRHARWISSEPHLSKYVHRIHEHVKTLGIVERDFLPSVKELNKLITEDSIIYMYVEEMLTQSAVCIPGTSPPPPPERITIHSLLSAINFIIQQGPKFDETDLVGCPLNALLDYYMCTTSGFAFFRDPKVNKVLKLILQEWCHFLFSERSCHVLNDVAPDGWFCPAALKQLNLDLYIHDDNLPHKGFTSWNDFFIRKFKPDKRPVASPDDDYVVVNACESAPLQFEKAAKLRDRFWVKGQPYSLVDMMGDATRALEFNGGSVYQAFLGATYYHRWHSPVAGTILDIVHKDGTYYSDSEYEGFDAAGPNNSQGYISSVATRGIIYISARAPGVGTVCIIFVGMAEVSSCVFTKNKGDEVEKGDELGYFQFGGSTHCIIFRKGVVDSILPIDNNHGIRKVNSYLATLVKPPHA